MTTLKIFCDGGARGNPGPAGIGFVIKNQQGKIIIKEGKYLGVTTNNVAEYQAVISALNWLVGNNSTTRLPDGQVQQFNKEQSTIEFYLDSLLVVQQLRGVYKVKNKKLLLLHTQIKILEAKLLKPVTYYKIPRYKNHEADLLVNTALDNFLNIR